MRTSTAERIHTHAMTFCEEADAARRRRATGEQRALLRFALRLEQLAADRTRGLEPTHSILQGSAAAIVSELQVLEAASSGLASGTTARA